MEELQEDLRCNLEHMLNSPFNEHEIRQRVHMILDQFLYRLGSRESDSISVKVYLEDYTAIVRGRNLFTHLLLHGHYVPQIMLKDLDEYETDVAVFGYIKDTLDDVGNVILEGYPYIKTLHE